MQRALPSLVLMSCLLLSSCQSPISAKTFHTAIPAAQDLSECQITGDGTVAGDGGDTRICFRDVSIFADGFAGTVRLSAPGHNVIDIRAANLDGASCASHVATLQGWLGEVRFILRVTESNDPDRPDSAYFQETKSDGTAVFTVNGPVRDGHIQVRPIAGDGVQVAWSHQVTASSNTQTQTVVQQQ